MRKDIKKSMERINKIQQLMSKVRSPYRGKSKQEIVEEIRKTRERIWEEKFAIHSR